MHQPTLPLALAHWMIERLTDTLDRPLEDPRTYGLTVIDPAVIDPAGFDPSSMSVRAAFVDPPGAPAGVRSAEARPDALAAASRVWLVPGREVVTRLARPHEFARRRPALAVAVVADDGMAVAMRFVGEQEITTVEPGRAAGLLVPVLLHWQLFDGHPSHDHPRRGAA